MTGASQIMIVSNIVLKWSARTDHMLWKYTQALLIIIGGNVTKKKKMRFQVFEKYTDHTRIMHLECLFELYILKFYISMYFQDIMKWSQVDNSKISMKTLH